MGVRPLARALVCLAWALAAWSAQARDPDCPAEPDVPWQSVAPGVWVWDGANDEPGPGNGGHVMPTTALVHGARAMVIDPGPGMRHAQRVKRSLRCRFGAQVRDVINTHAHAENALGNAAFADEIAAGTVTVWATLGTRQAMEQRCPACLESLTARVGADAMHGTHIVWPTATLFEDDTLVLGPLQLQVMRVEQGHTDADLVLWLPEAGVLWAGGLVHDGRLPEFAQGTLDGWLAALQRLAALQPRVVVGSRVGGPDMLAATQQYLTTLRRRVLAGMDAGRVAGEPGLVPMPEWSHWAGHARQEFNTQRAWRELEPVWMGVPTR